MEKFKLNYESREKLRSEVSKTLSDNATRENLGERKIHFDKDTLESILFEEVMINPSKGIKVKLPVFSGDILQCIDLSEISFEGVSWGLLGENDSDYFGIFGNLIVAPGADKHAIEVIKKIKEDVAKKQKSRTGYYKTNAVIDLSKSFEAKYGNCINISNCSFSPENISPNSFNHVHNINLADSCFCDIMIPKTVELTAVNSYLNGINLVARTIDAADYMQGSHASLGGCFLKETGISINLVPGKFRQLTESGVLKEKDWRDAIYIAYSSDWIGCYVNGKLVLSEADHNSKRSQLKKAYADYEGDCIEKVLGTISEQTTSTK